MHATIFDVFLNVCKTFQDRPAYIYRAGDEELTVTYGKFKEDVLLLSKAFRQRKVTKGSHVFLLSDNRYSWIVTDMALQSLGAVSVPRGSDTPTSELEYILEHSECSFLIVETEALLEQHNALIKKSKLKSVFVITGPEQHRMFDNVYAYCDLLKDRTISPADIAMFEDQRNKLHASDPLTIIYTSGTTGRPKGVVLTHSNIMHNVENLPAIIDLGHEDRWLSILPTWHIFERTAEYIAMASGSTLVYSSVKTFSADLEQYKPTLVATVPRLWESLYTKVNLAIKKQSPKKARMFHFLVRVSAIYRRNVRIMKDRLPVFKKPSFFVRDWDRTIAMLKIIALWPLYQVARIKLRAIQDKFGGRLRMAISGGGSLPGYLDEWIDAVGIRIVNAYGMTECSPGIAGRSTSCRIFGTLGKPVPGTEIKIVDENGWKVVPGAEGEIWVRGQQVTQGYYKDDEENKKAFTPDGFFKTGDLGRMTVTGELVITGRAKEIIVLASGENVDPTNIEAAISMFPFVNEAVLVGQDKKGLGALIVPDMEKLREYMTEKFNTVVQETEDILKDRQTLDKVKREINKLLNPKKGFKHYEKLHNIHFLDKEFKLGEELTNTFKKKRHVIERKYKDIINNLLK
jgi:long-chain acyl-CoA synthetase